MDPQTFQEVYKPSKKFIWGFCTFKDIEVTNVLNIILKSSLYSRSRGITPKSVTSNGAEFLGLAHVLHSSEETWQRWRAVGNTVSDLTGPGIEPQTSLMCLATELTNRYVPIMVFATFVVFLTRSAWSFDFN